MTSPIRSGRAIPVPSRRLSRLARLGGMASGIAGGMALDGARSLSAGRKPEFRDLLLTPANATRVADQLARMRGAAMKVGQMLSMDGGDMLPPELSEILSRLRADADFMPPRQLKKVLTSSWGDGWLQQFRRFDVRPVAAASIGQVHRAWTHDGRDLAIKVQYPGIRASIDSDVDNVATLVRMTGLLPSGMDIAPLLDEAKWQLREEADYRREGVQLRRYAELLAGDPSFEIPELQTDLTTSEILAMQFLEGTPVEDLETAQQAERDRVMAALLGLTFRELFSIGLMQTDPNFANYRYNSERRRIILLDFGAARPITAEVGDRYRSLFRAGLSGDAERLRFAALRAGFFGDDTRAYHQKAVLDMLELVFAPLRAGGEFDFGDRRLNTQLRDAGLALSAERDFVHVPPVDSIFVHRKLGGMFLLAGRLKARVAVREMLEPYL